MIVVIKLQSGGGRVGMSRKIFAVNQADVGICVVVVVAEGASGSHGSGERLLAEGAVVVGEVDSGLGGDIAELDLLGGTRKGRGQRYDDTIRNREGDGLS